MRKYCKKPNKTIVTHVSGVRAFVDTGLLWLRFYDRKRNETFINTAPINFCPMCGDRLSEGGK